jgi:hypothetical protein
VAIPIFRDPYIISDFILRKRAGGLFRSDPGGDHGYTNKTIHTADECSHEPDQQETDRSAEQQVGPGNADEPGRSMDAKNRTCRRKSLPPRAYREPGIIDDRWHKVE